MCTFIQSSKLCNAIHYFVRSVSVHCSSNLLSVINHHHLVPSVKRGLDLRPSPLMTLIANGLSHDQTNVASRVAIYLLARHNFIRRYHCRCKSFSNSCSHLVYYHSPKSQLYTITFMCLEYMPLAFSLLVTRVAVALASFFRRSRHISSDAPMFLSSIPSTSSCSVPSASVYTCVCVMHNVPAVFVHGWARPCFAPTGEEPKSGDTISKLRGVPPLKSLKANVYRGSPIRTHRLRIGS